VLCQKIPGLRPLVFPVQDHLDLGLGGSLRDIGDGQQGQSGSESGKWAFHGNSWILREEGKGETALDKSDEFSVKPCNSRTRNKMASETYCGEGVAQASSTSKQS